MTIFNRRTVIIIVVALVGLNFWRWWPDKVVFQADKQARSTKTEIDLQLTDSLYSYRGKQYSPRDLFSYVTSSQNVQSRIEAPIVLDKNESTPKVVKKDKARSAGMSLNKKMRLVGVLFDNNGRYAFILNRGKPLPVRVGDLVNGRYRVRRITETSVELYNMSTSNKFTLNL